MFKQFTLIGLFMFLAFSAFAQGGPGGPGGNMTPEMRQKIQAYRPVFDLTGTVGMLDEVEKQPKLAFSKAQAQKLLPILRDLLNRADLKPADAEKILTNIEDNILTDAQLVWMDKTRLARQEQMRQRQNGQQGQGGQVRVPGAPPIGNRPQGQGGPGGDRGGVFQAILQGKPFNPFKEQARTKENLTALIALMAKK